MGSSAVNHGCSGNVTRAIPSVTLSAVGMISYTCGCAPALPNVPTAIPAQAATEKPVPKDPPADPSPGDTWVRPGDGMVMVYVPSGTFQMGSAVGDLYTESDEYPQHTVTLDGFWLE
jgi:formylglycine-generating enzyme required for sulfatase activity